MARRRSCAPCLRISRSKKAVETSNLLEIQHWAIVTSSANSFLKWSTVKVTGKRKKCKNRFTRIYSSKVDRCNVRQTKMINGQFYTYRRIGLQDRIDFSSYPKFQSSLQHCVLTAIYLMILCCMIVIDLCVF